MAHACAHREQTLMIDALPLLFEGGISNYLKPLVQALLKYAGRDLHLKLLFRLSIDEMRRQLYGRYVSENSSTKKHNLTTHLPDRLLNIIWSRGCYLPFSLPNRSDDFFIASTEMVPRKGACRVGWIVYDLTPLCIPKFFASMPDHYRDKMKSLAKRTDFIATISRNSKKDIVELLHYPEDRVYVIYPGVSPSKERCAMPSVSGRRPYVYYIGSLALNKNVDGMLRIFSQCVNRYGLDFDLVLTGKDFCGRPFWDQMIRELNIEGRVRITGWISEHDRENYLNHATMLWQFSWYEGFGLPVLEAASRGIPVLYSNRGALPEILNNPEQEIDPDDEEEAAWKAAQALMSPDTLSGWKKSGLQRSLGFSWEASARRLIRHLREMN